MDHSWSWITVGDGSQPELDCSWAWLIGDASQQIDRLRKMTLWFRPCLKRWRFCEVIPFSTSVWFQVVTLQSMEDQQIYHFHVACLHLVWYQALFRALLTVLYSDTSSFSHILKFKYQIRLHMRTQIGCGDPQSHKDMVDMTQLAAIWDNSSGVQWS